MYVLPSVGWPSLIYRLAFWGIHCAKLKISRRRNPASSNENRGQMYLRNFVSFEDLAALAGTVSFLDYDKKLIHCNERRPAALVNFKPLDT